MPTPARALALAVLRLFPQCFCCGCARPSPPLTTTALARSVQQLQRRAASQGRSSYISAHSTRWAALVVVVVVVVVVVAARTHSSQTPCKTWYSLQ